MFSNGNSFYFCKKPRNVHFDLILFFHFPVKLVLPRLTVPFRGAHHIYCVFSNLPSYKNGFYFSLASNYGHAGYDNCSTLLSHKLMLALTRISWLRP